MRIVVIGAGVGGLAAGVRLAATGHRVVVVEQAHAPGGKAGRLERDGFRWDTGPSLLTMPWVLRDLFEDTGAPLDDEVELVRVEPATRYHFADGTQLELGADLPRTLESLEAWSPGTGSDWVRFLGTCAEMWRASVPFLTGLPPWPPRRPRPGEPPPDPRDLLRVRPWLTLRGLARSTTRDPRLRMVIERFATYAGGDPRRAPAALAVAGYVEHAFGAWHVRGGIYSMVQALARRLEAVGGELRLTAPARAIRRSRGRVAAVDLDDERLACEAVVCTADALAMTGGLLPAPGEEAFAGSGPRGVSGVLTGSGARGRSRERSLSGFALMLGLRGRDAERAHHTIRFPADYAQELDDVFVARRPVRDPTLYESASWVSDPDEAPDDGENLFVLVNAPSGGVDWEQEAGAYEQRLVERLGVGDRVATRARRTPADLERETGAPGGAIYGDAPHGRLASLRRPPNVSRATRGLYLVGGTTHPGGGLPLVMLSARIVAREIGPARIDSRTRHSACPSPDRAPAHGVYADREPERRRSSSSLPPSRSQAAAAPTTLAAVRSRPCPSEPARPAPSSSSRQAPVSGVRSWSSSTASLRPTLGPTVRGSPTWSARVTSSSIRATRAPSLRRTASWPTR